MVLRKQNAKIVSTIKRRSPVHNQ